jgi:hypothetical protein
LLLLLLLEQQLLLQLLLSDELGEHLTDVQARGDVALQGLTRLLVRLVLQERKQLLL